MTNENEDRKQAIDEIGEGLVEYGEYLHSLTPEIISARNAALAITSTEDLSDLDLFIIAESTRALGGQQ